MADTPADMPTAPEQDAPPLSPAAVPNRAAVRAAVAGPQQVAAAAPMDGVRLVDMVVLGLLVVLLMRGPVAPGPGPTPGPVDPIVDPIVDPPITQEKLPKGSFLVVVEETEKRDKYPHMATLQKEVAFWDGLEARGYKYRWVDTENVEPEVQALKATWERVGTPCLIGLSPTGEVLLAVSCPPQSGMIEQYLAK